MKLFAFKVDIDTERGTKIGLPNLMNIFKEFNIPATFYLSLGPDHTGRAIQRIFRPGFLKKVSRTSIVSTYGIRTLLNGVLLPGPHIGKKHTKLLRSITEQGFDVGIHAYDHQKWQDGVTKMPEHEIQTELTKAQAEFQRIFNSSCITAAAPGWQANAKTLAAYDSAKFKYASDCRGVYPFLPKVGSRTFTALQIPTTLPTLDELFGDPEFPQDRLAEHFLALLQDQYPNIMTIHTELEGMMHLTWLREFLKKLKGEVQFTTLAKIAENCFANPKTIPVCELIQSSIKGRSGLLAIQKT